MEFSTIVIFEENYIIFIHMNVYTFLFLKIIFLLKLFSMNKIKIVC